MAPSGTFPFDANSRIFVVVLTYKARRISEYFFISKNNIMQDSLCSNSVTYEYSKPTLSVNNQTPHQ